MLQKMSRRYAGGTMEIHRETEKEGSFTRDGREFCGVRENKEEGERERVEKERKNLPFLLLARM